MHQSADCFRTADVVQVFMMPGAIFINVLAGSLYGLWGTFLVIAGVSTLGASLNYWLSRLVVRVRPCCAISM